MSEQNFGFRSLRTIENSYRNMRIFVFVSNGLLAIVAISAIVFAYRVKTDSESRIYVVEQGKSLIAALRSNVGENRPVEGRDHIRRFHELFFTLDDANSIEEHVNEALPYADASVNRLYQDTKEKGYYNQLIQASATQEVQIDSIRLDLNQYPYAFRTFARQQIIRPTSLTIRRLITKGYLRNVSRSDINPHGFMIEKFEVVDNTDIEERARQ